MKILNFVFPTGRIRVCEIRFASTCVICGNTRAYPVYNKNKNLSEVWGVDGKIRPDVYCLAPLGLPTGVRLWSRGTDFLYVPHTHDRFFFLHIFHFWKSVFDNAVTSIADVRHIVMTIPWRLVMSLRSVTSTLTMAYSDVLYNQCLSNTRKFSILVFPTGRIRVCEIRFTSTGVMSGNLSGM